MKDVRYIAFNADHYDSKSGMFEAISKLIQILTDARYVCSVRYEDCNIYIVEYDDEDSELAQFELWHEIDFGEGNDGLFNQQTGGD